MLRSAKDNFLGARDRFISTCKIIENETENRLAYQFPSAGLKNSHYT